MNKTRRLIISILIVVFVLGGLLFSLINSLRPGGKKEGQPKEVAAKIPPLTLIPGTNLSPKAFLLEKGIQPPGEANLYSVYSADFVFTETLARTLAGRWGFLNEPKIDQTQSGRSLLFTSPTDDRMVINENPLSLTYSKNIPLDEPLPKLEINESQASTLSQQFLQKLLLNFPPEVSLRRSGIEFLKSAGPYVRRVQALEDANEIRIFFGLYRDGQRLFVESSPENTMSVSVFADGVVSSAQVILPFGLGVLNPSLTKEADVLLRNETDVREAIKSREAVIKKLAVAGDSREGDLSAIPDYLTLTNFEVGYLATLSNGKNYLYPIYVFKAGGALADGKTVEGLVYLKAIR